MKQIDKSGYILFPWDIFCIDPQDACFSV